MILWTCNACGLVIVPDGTTPEALEKATGDHAKKCSGRRSS